MSMQLSPSLEFEHAFRRMLQEVRFILDERVPGKRPTIWFFDRAINDHEPGYWMVSSGYSSDEVKCQGTQLAEVVDEYCRRHGWMQSAVHLPKLLDGPRTIEHDEAPLIDDDEIPY